MTVRPLAWFTLKGLDSDDCGIQPAHFEDMCANERITALVCTPNLNNSTGTLMPDSRRRAIANIAERYGVHVIEDDVFGPLLKKCPAPTVGGQGTASTTADPIVGLDFGPCKGLREGPSSP